ncbi:MAG TPA: type II toxin-antitoxin system HicB family antitoxin [Stellaceae bacterium]|nr:type II toxin-antitoxin system HicB family antitoxin [Stellaceae bacterium]
MYPISLEPDDNGTLLATCPDLPEVTSFGDNLGDALRHAADAIEEALGARIAHHDDIPLPSPPDHRPVAILSPLTEAKVQLYRLSREAGMSKAELGRRLGWHAPQVDRLFDLRHRSKIEQIEEALRVIGKRLVIRVADAA